VVCFFNDVEGKCERRLQGWFPSFLENPKGKFYSQVVGQLFYSGYVNRLTYIDCFLVYKPSGEILLIPSINSGGHPGFFIKEDEVCDIVVRYGDSPKEFIRYPLLEGYDYLSEAWKRFDNFIPNRYEDIFFPQEENKDLLGDKKILLAHAVYHFSRHFFVDKEKKILHVKPEKLFLTTFDSFLGSVGVENRSELFGRYVSRFI
jgi:hypothetical protein